MRKLTLVLGMLGLIASGCATAPPAPEPVIAEAPAPAPPPVVILPPTPAPAPPVIVTDPYGTVLAGILDLPRSYETAAADGCARVRKGHTIGGGFMFFACEKLRPEIGIDRHEAAARDYTDALMARGWEARGRNPEGAPKFTRTDPTGCKINLTVKPWTDRNLNEPKGRTRDDFRQIVFVTTFKGPACEPQYKTLSRSLLS